VVENGQVSIGTATATVAAANRESGRLRDAADDLAARLAAPVKPAAIPALPPQARQLPAPPVLLADVLKRIDQRAGDLAEVADQAKARGVTCERAYDGIAK